MMKLNILLSEFKSISKGESREVKIANGILHGISTGVFLYCTFLGLLAEELGERSKLSLVLMVLMGFLLMVGLAAIPEKKTSHSYTNVTMSPFITAYSTGIL